MEIVRVQLAPKGYSKQPELLAPTTDQLVEHGVFEKCVCRYFLMATGYESV